MKVLKFDNCEYLTKISNLSSLPNLENFSFENCKNLITIHNSIGLLNKLEFLNASGCIKLKGFPPLKLTSLKDLNLSRCKCLRSFPEILGKIETMNSIDIWETSIEEFPISFQNLTGLTKISIEGRGMFSLPSFISKMSKLSSICFNNSRLLMPRPPSTVSSNVKQIFLQQENNFLFEYFPIVLTWFNNEEELDLDGSNFKILLECLQECCRLREVRLNCKSLEEIRGITPTLVIFDALNCISLHSSSRSMLLRQVLNRGTVVFSCINILFNISNVIHDMLISIRNYMRVEGHIFVFQ
jgi:hypothetical protein